MQKDSNPWLLEGTVITYVTAGGLYSITEYQMHRNMSYDKKVFSEVQMKAVRLIIPGELYKQLLRFE